MKHFIKNENIGIVVSRQCVDDWKYVFLTKNINSFNLTGTAGRLGSGYTCPLYLYPEATGSSVQQRIPNLNQEIINQITKKLDLNFTNEKEDTKKSFAPIDILDYIYAVLHSPAYREKYKEFLKIDFPRVPYPKDDKSFWELVALGGELRQIHLLESNKVEDYITSYEMAANAENDHNVITTKIVKKDWEITDTEKQLGRIWINESKYFDNVPVTAWEFYIGGYQPAQKWLKDRKERELKFEDILHYQKIIVALT
jgi:predicted helicase